MQQIETSTKEMPPKERAKLEVEALIKALPMLTRQQRAKLREAAAKHIAGTHDMPQDAPAYISNSKWNALRGICIQANYEARIKGQPWEAGKDEAFKNHAGGGKPSVILPCMTWRT